jgi:tight adherence protein C
VLLLAFIGLGLAVGLALYAVLAGAQEKAAMRASLRSLATYEVEDVRGQELLDPLLVRAIKPLLARVQAFGRRLPLLNVEATRQKFVTIGEASPDALDRYLGMRVILLAATPVAAAVVWFVLPVGGLLRMAMVAFVSFLMISGPDATLNRKVAERKLAILRAMPDTLDLLTISVEAGLGFEQAIDRTVRSVPGPLSDELSRMLGETRAGSTRSDAMRSMDKRVDMPEMRAFVLAILQADTFGVSIGRVLRAQADEMRVKRRQNAQERAMKAPVKMMVPMVLCIFPAIFAVVLAPAIINMRATG